MALNITSEYFEGRKSDIKVENPYDFWDEYEKHYAFDIGRQERE